jgi:hypothetical protein
MNIVILYRTNDGIVTATYNGRSITVDQNDEWADVSYDVECGLGIRTVFPEETSNNREFWEVVNASEERIHKVVQAIVDLEEAKGSVRL